MGDGSLSQEEIDALLRGTESVGDIGGIETGGPTAQILSPAHAEILGDTLNEIMQSASMGLSALLGEKLSISHASVEEISPEKAQSIIPTNSILAAARLGNYTTYFILEEKAAKKIASLMMGSQEEPPEITEAHITSIKEFLSQLGATLANNLGTKLQEPLAIQIQEVKVFRGPQDAPSFPGPVARIQYLLSIGGESSLRFIQYLDANVASQFSQKLTPQQAPQEAPSAGAPAAAETQVPQGGVTVNPVEFPSLQAPTAGFTQMPTTLDLLMDVQMTLTVELGRTKKYVKDILNLGEGSIIELDKLAGEPVDVLVNGKLIAKGEVVVIDENFGVRITDIVAPPERLQKMTSS